MSRLDRITKLRDAVKEYVEKEQEKIDEEVKFLDKVLSSRGGGKGIQSSGSQQVSKAALNDLDSYLKGD